MKKSAAIIIFYLVAALVCGCAEPSLPSTTPSTGNTQPTQTATTPTNPSTTVTTPATEPNTESTTQPSTDPVLSTEEAAYLEAEALLAGGKTAEAAIAFGKLAGYADARERSFALWDEVAARHTIAVTFAHSFAILENGEVIYGGKEYLEIDGGAMEYQHLTEASQWNNVIALESYGGHLMGLHSDGSVSFLCNEPTPTPCKDLSHWADIVAICTVGDRAYGLRLDGTVVCNPEHIPTSIQRNIVAIGCGSTYFLALKSDGTLYCSGTIANDADDVSEWSDITAIACSSSFVLGLRSDGTVLCTDPEYTPETDTWTDVVTIFPGELPIGLTADGTVLIAGEHSYTEPIKEWKNIVDIYYEDNFYLGLCANGTLVCCGFFSDGQDEITAFTSVKSP